MSNVDAQPSLQGAMGVVRTWWDRQRLAVRFFLGTCTALYVVTLLGIIDTYTVCSSGSLLLGRWQVWRLVLAPFFHLGLLHLLFNSLALVQLLPPLENGHGTSGALTIAALYALLAQLIAIAPATVLHVLFGIGGPLAGAWTRCNVGLSGMLFGILTLEVAAQESSGTFRRVVCGYTMPAKAYPWALALLLGLFFPGVSTEVHVGGILAAYILPPPSRLRGLITRIDSSFPAFVKSLDSFVPANRAPLPHSTDSIQGGWSWAAAPATSASRSASVASAGGVGKAFPGAGRVLGSGAGEQPAAAVRSTSTAISSPTQRSHTPAAASPRGESQV